jgi:SAM-dependent methyltransferase
MSGKLRRQLDAVKRAAWRMLARIPLGARRQCNVCRRKVRRFLPYRGGLPDVPPLLRQLHVIGSDVENFECPACGCHDRERHLLLYMNAEKLFLHIGGARVLHFAPEAHLQRFIREAGPAEYVLADLFPSSPEIRKLDLQAITYPTDHFDFVLANHVLEHVNDDAQALREIFRVLRPGGYAILQTPYASGLSRKFEDPAISSEGACLHAYGQEDHRRLYGRDFVLRVEESGLCHKGGTHAKILPGVDAARNGVNAQEPLLLFQKPISA